MTDLNELLERVREAKGPDRELDHALWLHFDETAQAKYDAGRIPLPWTWCLTSSIDAALALTERLLPGSMKRVFDNPDDGSSRAEIVSGLIYSKGDHDTWPLAILSALLTALKEVR